MDPSIPIEGAIGAVGGGITLAGYVLAQAIRSRMNGKRNTPPCAEHSERMTRIEGSLRVINTVLDRLVGDLKTSETETRKAESANVIVVGEHGERLATLEASNVSIVAGIARIEVSLDQIQKALNT